MGLCWQICMRNALCVRAMCYGVWEPLFFDLLQTSKIVFSISSFLQSNFNSLIIYYYNGEKKTTQKQHFCPFIHPLNYSFICDCRLQINYAVFKLLLIIIYPNINLNSIMKSHIFSKLTILLFFLLLQHSATIHIHPTPFSISSAVKNNQFQMVISLSSSLSHQQLQLTTQALSANHVHHTLTLTPDKVHIEPDMEDENVVFNYKHEDQYLIGLAHNLADKRIHFISVQVGYQGQKKQFLLAALDTKLHQISFDGLYSCHKTLVSIQQTQQDDTEYTLRLFTQSKEQGIWYTDKDSKYERHYDNGVYFGRMKLKKNQTPYNLRLSSGNYCVLNIVQMRKVRPQRKSVPIRKYYSVSDLLEDVARLQVKQSIYRHQIEEQL